MAIWASKTINELPEIELVRWTIIEVDKEGGNRHFIGWNQTEFGGRVSSKIVEFDKDTMTGKTNSGRIYKLIGRNGNDHDAAYVLSFWLARNNIQYFKDISLDI